MEQRWFEMSEIRRKRLAEAVWIPLRRIEQIRRNGRPGHCGYIEESRGVRTLAVPVRHRHSANQLQWQDICSDNGHRGYVERGRYRPADEYRDGKPPWTGLHLVLEQPGNSEEQDQWHLHQDLAIALGLKRENDIWLRPDEGYETVVKLHRAEDGRPCGIEIRSSHLRDYLCARKMALYATSFQGRVEICECADHISWSSHQIQDDCAIWEGHVVAIHEGGMPHGGGTAVLQVSRTDVDPEVDVPVMEPPADCNTATESWTIEHGERKLYRIEGAMRKCEWIEPALRSPIVRGDEEMGDISFIADAEGNHLRSTEFVDTMRWLWFRPEVMSTLAHRRGGALGWYTRNTGDVGCSPDYPVVFGMNSLGLINVFAEDIARLPHWQMKIWSGFNCGPDGRVCEELLAAQMRCQPAETCAPEVALRDGLERLEALTKVKLGVPVVRSHAHFDTLVTRAHRFRAVDESSLLMLAKDIARLTADSLDAKVIQRFVKRDADQRLGSLKSLEKLLASKVDVGAASAMLAPLFGAYELRHADAHLPGFDLERSYRLVGVESGAPYVIRGVQMLASCASSIEQVCQVFETW